MRLGRVLVIAAVVAAPVIAPITASLAQTNVNGSNNTSGGDASSGSANGSNSASGQTGLAASPSPTPNPSTQDVKNSNGTNVQEGSNRTTIHQTSNVRTGDVVVGQVIGAVVSSGNLTINARNTSENVDATSGDASGTNTANTVTGLVSSGSSQVADAAFAGLAIADNPNAKTADLNNVVGRNVQQGSNSTIVRQTVNAQTGDAVGGQVIGAVVNGGTTDIVASNRTVDSDITTGDARGSNKTSGFTGLLDTQTSTVGAFATDITGSTGVNVQEGDNRFIASQVARSRSGDGIAGQVLGVVSAGNTRVDASNVTTDSSVETGDATTNNSGSAFVGLLSAATSTVAAADLTGVTGTNLQDGRNKSTLNQNADAVTGDGIAGQVAGVVTSAGGSAALTLANTSTNIDSTTGEARFSNASSLFDGLSVTKGGSVVANAADQPLSAIFKSAIS